MMFVVFLIAVMCSLAAPGIKRQIKDAQDREFISDLLELASAFQAYQLIHNQCHSNIVDSETNFANYPTLRPFLSQKQLTQVSIGNIGNKFAYDDNSYGPEWGGGLLAIYKNGLNRTPEEMTKIDALFDDGNLDTGMFTQLPDFYQYKLLPPP